MPPFEFIVKDSDLWMCLEISAARGRTRKPRFKNGGNKWTKRAYRCGQCNGMDQKIQSCPFTEEHIPTKPASQPSTGSGTSGNEDPVLLDSED